MKLEALSTYPDEKAHATPLVLVHGAWHGNSQGRQSIRWFSAGEYVADVEQVVKSLNTPPALIGHSMDGYVIQKYLESHSVLLTS